MTLDRQIELKGLSMKKLILVTVMTALSLPAWSAPEAAAGKAAAPADQKPSVMIKVKRLQSTGKTQDNHYGSYYYYGSDYKTTTSGVTLEAEVRLMSKTPATLQMEWYFIAKTVNSGKQWLCDKGEKTLELGAPVTTTKERIASQTLQGSNWSSYWGSYDGGSKIDGYIVLVKWQDKVVKAVGSSRDVEDIAYSPEKLKKLIATQRNTGSVGSGGGNSGNNN